MNPPLVKISALPPGRPLPLYRVRWAQAGRIVRRLLRRGAPLGCFPLGESGPLSFESVGHKAHGHRPCEAFGRHLGRSDSGAISQSVLLMTAGNGSAVATTTDTAGSTGEAEAAPPSKRTALALSCTAARSRKGSWCAIAATTPRAATRRTCSSERCVTTRAIWPRRAVQQRSADTTTGELGCLTPMFEKSACSLRRVCSTRSLRRGLGFDRSMPPSWLGAIDGFAQAGPSRLQELDLAGRPA